ncbi:MAG: M1 family metallopeptidase, partial [Phototrophicaceae bacterium]
DRSTMPLPSQLILFIAALVIALSSSGDAVLQAYTPASAESCSIDDDTPMTRHTVAADIDYTNRRVSVQQRVRYVNRTDDYLPNIVLNVEANRWRDTFFLEQVNGGAETMTYSLEAKRLSISLAEPLPPGCEIVLQLVFRLDMPLIGHRSSGYKGFFGYTNRQMNLGHWLPTVAPYRDGQWISHQAIIIGEQEVMEMANWDVTVSLLPPGNDITIAGPGTVTRISPSMWRYTLPNAREFPLTLSHEYVLSQAQTASGVDVELYTFPEALTSGAAEHALEAAVQALEYYAGLWGEYPYERMLVVVGDFPDGMEFTGLVFVGANWFAGYNGNPRGYLLLITVHEVSHQWFYALVGSDQALHPWLDEAIATYSEHIFLEEYYPDLTEWWWNFRVMRYDLSDDVDRTVYEYDNQRSYINAAYLRAAQMLHDVRADLGDDGFFQLLADHAEVNAGIIATPDDFWTLLTAEQLEQTEDTRRRYLRDPGPVGE